MKNHDPGNKTWWLRGFLAKPPKGSDTKSVRSDDSIDSKLRDHPIFHELDKYESILSNTIRIDDPLKKKMVSCYLKILCSVANEILEEVIANREKYAGGNMNALTMLMYKKYEGIRYTALSQGVPELFLDKIGPRITEALLTLSDVITDLQHQHRYSNQYDEVFTFMDVYLLQIRNNYNTITGIVNNMNGELHRALEGSPFDLH